MTPCRLHITGASGTGTTSLGRALADEWSVPHADSDDYYWEPTAPPYRVKRPVAARLELMEAVFARRDAWVLSGSVMGWGEPLIKRFDAVVFLTLEPSLRLERLKEREHRRSGSSIGPGGERERAFHDFINWAASYDNPDFEGRSMLRHEKWLASLPCPVLRVHSSEPLSSLLEVIQAWSPDD